VRDDDDVAILEASALGKERREIVTLADLRQAGDGDDAQLAQGRPVRRTPACAP
jgi:hypothetical protein